MSEHQPTGWVSDADAPADAVDRMYAASLDGVLLRGVLTTQECVAAMIAVSAYDEWQRVYLDPMAPKSIGVMLAPSPVHPDGPPVEVYFGDVERDNRWLERHLAPLIPRVEERLTRLAGGRPVCRLAQPRAHRAATVREMGLGFGAPLHVDAYREGVGLASLFAHTDRTTQLSWYVLLREPGAAGELEVRARSTNERHVIRLNAGDGVLFDGARLEHQVTPVSAPPSRISVGGFAGLSTRHDGFHYWG